MRPVSALFQLSIMLPPAIRMIMLYGQYQLARLLDLSHIVVPDPGPGIVTPSISPPPSTPNVLTDPQAVAAIIAAIITTAATIAIAVLPGVIRHIRHRHEDGKQRPGDMQQHVKHYCENLQQSPRIVQLQVLDMPQPVNIKDVYVQLRVYTNQWLSYKLDEDLRQAEIEQDPASLIAAVKHSQEQRLQEEIDINQAIRQYRHIVIVGDPGVGKTTLLKHLTIKSTRGELWECPRIPIYLELSMFNTDMYTNLLDLVVEQWHQYDDMPDTMLRSYLEQAMDKGDILLLIDGLDETAVGSSKEQSEQAYMHTLRSIQVLVDRFPRTHVIVTVRKATYRSQYWPRLQGFNEMEIGEFTSDAIHKFIRNWFEAANIDNAERFIRDLTSLLRRNSRLEELASNPLLLSLIVVVYKQHLELPENRAMLYERCVATILTRWDAMRSKIRRRIFQTDHKLMLCKEIAWHFHENGMRYFPENELLDVIARFLPTINLEPDQNREILDEIMQVHGLIKAQAQNLYGFSHMTFQEYFAALYIKDGLHGNGQSLLDTLIAHVDKSWWEEVLQLYASITPDAGPLLEKLLEHCQSSDLCESLFHTNLLRAGRCLETNPVVKDNQLRERIVDQLFSILQATPYASLQREIAITLTRIGGRAVNQRLLQMLSPIPQKTINLEISTHIADALGHSSDQRVTSSLLTLLNNKQVNQQVRAHVALALGQLGEYYPHVRKNILAQLTDMEEDWYVRLRLADALGELGDPTIAPELLQLLKQHGKTDLTCYRIAVVLGKLGNRDVIPDLQYLLQDNQFHDYVRSGIVTALRIMADQHIVAYFMQVLKDEHIKEYVRCQVARAFNEISREYIPVTDLFHILECANINSAVRAELAATICTLGEQEAIPGLLQLLIDPQTDTPLRVSIVSILGCLTNPSVLSPLHELLKQPGLPIDLQGNILASLSMTGEDGILPDVLAFLEGQEFPLVCPRAQINLFTALGHVGRRNPLYEQDIIQQLLKRLRDKQVNVYVGRSITEALAMLNLQAYVPELLDLLVDHANINSYIRQGIAITLSQCRQDSSIQQRLLMLLQDSDIPDDIFEALRKSCRS